MSNVRSRIVFGVLLVVLGAVAFLVASSYVVDRGYSKILAGIAGALVFPVLPVAWHAWSERGRAKRRAEAKKPAKSSLTGADRYWMRFGVVVLLVIGPMVYASRIEVLRAPFRHGLWFVPTPKPGIGAIGLGAQRDFPDQESLLRRVPSDAEAAIVWHDAKEGRDTVIAYGGHQAMGVGRPTFARAVFDQAAKQLLRWIPLEPLAVVPNSDGLELQATDGWRTKVEPPAGTLPPEIRRELARAPQDATIAIGFAPHATPVAARVKSGALWAVEQGDKVTIELRVQARDVAAATAMLDAARAALHGDSLPDACKAAVGKLADADVAQVGLAVVAHVVATDAVLADLESCAN
ncbi:MAG TPA: hypothetical protein VGL61_07435 [Kofleriaceae bacterium]